MKYSLRLLEIRNEHQLNQEEVARILGITRTVYTKYENGYELIPIKHLIAFCDYFKVSVDYVFSLNNSKKCDDKFNLELVPFRLKEWRKKSSITQENLAKFLNTNKSVICNYEKGRYFIATPFLYQLCHKYHVSADYLLGRIDKNSQN